MKKPRNDLIAKPRLVSILLLDIGCRKERGFGKKRIQYRICINRPIFLKFINYSCIYIYNELKSKIG